MFETAADGRIKLDKASSIDGGHELELSKYDAEKGLFYVPHSWGDSWGKDGWGYFTEADLAYLLSKQGDVTVPALIGAPAPTPTPVPPTPTPAPPVPVPDVDKSFGAALRAFITAALAWLSQKGL
jgi:hypothetical protein